VFEAVRNQATLKIQAALAVGEKEWKRSKIMLVGEGRAGKTALAKSFMGLPFAHTESTCGIEQFRLEVNHAALAGPAWQQREAPDSELDAAIVEMAKAVKMCTPLTPVLAKATSTTGAEPSSDERLQLTSLTVEKVEHIRSTLLGENLFGRSGSDLLVSLYDFAGQDIFSCLHSFFLTSHGVYVIVFDMTWLTVNSVYSVGALEYLSFWLNSVAANTSTGEQKMAPIFLVGTHKDQVARTEDHSDISNLLRKVFSYSTVWPFVVENKPSGLVYFPVDCTMGTADPTTGQLMALIEQTIRKSDYISTKRPLSWYRALDALQAMSDSSMSLSAVQNIACNCGVDPDALNEMLAFLRDMGVLMWYDTPCLRETVILDPVDYFVKPVTRVICQSNIHTCEVHDACRKQRCEEFDTLFSTGIASYGVLKDLLNHGGRDADTLIPLMMKYGLATCWQLTDNTAAVPLPGPEYLIPSLFPVASSSQLARAWVDDRSVRTTYFVLSLEKSLGSRVLIDDDLQRIGFLPKGLFDRLLCATLDWCHETEPQSVILQFTLCKSFAILKAAGVWFRISLVPSKHCIKMEFSAVDSGQFNAFISGLYQRWKAVVDGGVQSLSIVPFVPYMGLPNHHLILVPLPVSVVEATTCPGSTVPCTAEHRDCFLSYRWNESDKGFVTLLHEHMTEGFVRGYKWRVFLDDKVLQTADRFQRIFFASVVATEAFIPLVSPNALQRMVTHDPQEIDNLLIEWLTALLLMNYPDFAFQAKSRLRLICPICVKSSTADDYAGVKISLPRTVPVATIRKLKELVRHRGMIVSSEVTEFLNTVTVRDIVDGVMESIYIAMEVGDDVQDTVRKCGQTVMSLFFQADGITVPANYLSSTPGDN
jgi:GTPase SAR1 family protein